MYDGMLLPSGVVVHRPASLTTMMEADPPDAPMCEGPCDCEARHRAGQSHWTWDCRLCRQQAEQEA